MSEAAKYLMAGGLILAFAGFIVWFRLHRLPNIPWNLFDCYGLLVCVTCVTMTAFVIVFATRS